MSTLHRALVLSMLAHGALLLLLAHYEKESASETARARLKVQLVPAPPETMAAARPAPSTPPPSPREPIPTPAPAANETTAPPVDWRAEARAVVASMDANTDDYRAQAQQAAPANLVATPGRIPGLDAGFRPMRRQLKVCGRLLEFTFGVHEISMPVGYLCDDKAVEYKMAPGAGRNINAPAQNGD